MFFLVRSPEREARQGNSNEKNWILGETERGWGEKGTESWSGKENVDFKIVAKGISQKWRRLRGRRGGILATATLSRQKMNAG
jgi:hypothetical protein